MSKGAIIIIIITAGIGLGILGWSQAESVHVAEIKPLSQAIHVANNWWVVAVVGGALILSGLGLLAAGWGRGK